LFVKFFFCKKLPSLFINLTENNYISKEIKNKNIPLINFFKISTNNRKNLGDYFLYNVGFLVNIDILFFFIKVFKFIKFYKNV
jgi:iron only hydrogenase large subunit-like protein